MRSPKLALPAVLALVLAATTANAASIGVIWQNSGTSVTTAISGSSVTANIVLTPTTPLAGAGSVLELSADSTGGAIITGAAQIILTGWLALGTPTIGNPHSENVIVQGDLLGYGAPVAGPTTIGTITVQINGPGSVTVQASGGADDIFSGAGSVIGEYSFLAGEVFVGPSHAVSTSASPPEGGTTSGDGNYAAGSTATVQATSNLGYEFVNWTVSDVPVSNSATFSFTVTGSRTLVAVFQANSYTIALVPFGEGTTSGGGSYFHGSMATAEATADPGYKFVKWLEWPGGAEVSTSATYDFEVTGPRTLVAVFAVGPPVNDGCDDAIPGTGPLPFRDSLNTTQATEEVDEPSASCGGGGIGSTVWYSFTPASDMAISVDTFGSDYDTVLSIWDAAESCGTLATEFECSDDDQGVATSYIEFHASAGSTYLIRVGEYQGESGGNLVFILGEAPFDSDGDGIPGDGVAGEVPCAPGQVVDCDDNCPTVPNVGQADEDADGIGDECEGFGIIGPECGSLQLGPPTFEWTPGGFDLFYFYSAFDYTDYGYFPLRIGWAPSFAGFQMGQKWWDAVRPGSPNLWGVVGYDIATGKWGKAGACTVTKTE